MSLIWPTFIIYSIIFSRKLQSLLAAPSVQNAYSPHNDWSHSLDDDSYDENAAILRKCLAPGASDNISLADLHKLESFESWHETEKLPCFSHCLSVKKGWFDAAAGKWNSSKLAADLSENVYKYCEQVLELNANGAKDCNFVYRGFRCLREATYRTAETYMALVSCAIELNATSSELQQYAVFPVAEHIPCLFKCFAQKFHFYTKNYEWNFENWLKALGPLAKAIKPVDYSACRASATDRAKLDGECSWMYQEYLCLRNLNNKNTPETTTTTTTTTA